MKANGKNRKKGQEKPMENKAWIPLVQTKGIQGGGVGEMKEPGNEFG